MLHILLLLPKFLLGLWKTNLLLGRWKLWILNSFYRVVSSFSPLPMQSLLQSCRANHSPSLLAGFSRHSLSEPSKTKPPDIFYWKDQFSFMDSWNQHHFLHTSFSAHAGHLPLNFLLTLTHAWSFLNHDSSGSNAPRDTYFGMRLCCSSAAKGQLGKYFMSKIVLLVHIVFLEPGWCILVAMWDIYYKASSDFGQQAWMCASLSRCVPFKNV